MKKTPIRSLIVLLSILTLPAWGQETAVAAGEPRTPEDREQLRVQARDMRAQAKRMRAEAAQALAAAEKSCWEKFLVSNCLEEAKAAERATDREAKTLEIEAGRIERRIKAHEREEKAARRAAEAPQRAAKAAKRAEELQLQEEEALRRQAEKAAEIERRKRKAE